MAIQVMCGSCAKRFRAGDKLAGKKVRCPECKGVISIPAAPEVRVDQPSATPNPAHVSQPVSQPAAAQPASTPQAAPMANSNIASLLEQEQLPVERRCPACSQLLGLNDVLCVGCGYDTRSQTVLQPKKQSKGTSKKSAKLSKKASRAKDATGAFIKGVICSVIGALIGSAVWYGVAMGTGYQIGWIAWGLGLAAGAGMQIGYGKNDGVAGITAAFVACFGILAAKWMIFSNVLLPFLENDAASTISLFFETCFHPKDGIFILLAFFTAYRVGAGKSND